MKASKESIILKLKKPLFKWWRNHKGDFPWRKVKDPWKVLVAAILLRKTNATTVSKYFNAILREFSSLDKVLSTPLTQIENILKPLGMYKVRARQLKAAAEVIAREYCGEVPSKMRELLKVPGIGRYSAALILSIAYNKYIPIIDVNVTRVIERVTGKMKLKSEVIERMICKALRGREILEFSLATIDLARTICKKSNPKCASCPLNQLCKWERSKSLKV